MQQKADLKSNWTSDYSGGVMVYAKPTQSNEHVISSAKHSNELNSNLNIQKRSYKETRETTAAYERSIRETLPSFAACVVLCSVHAHRSIYWQSNHFMLKSITQSAYGFMFGKECHSIAYSYKVSRWLLGKNFKSKLMPIEFRSSFNKKVFDTA